MCVCVFVCTSASICVYPCETVFHWSRICLQKHDLLFAHEWIIMCLYAEVRLHLFEHCMLRIFHSYCICLCATHFHICDTCMWMYACMWVSDWNLPFMELHFQCEIRVYPVKHGVNLQCFSSQSFPSSPHFCLFLVYSLLIWLLFTLMWLLLFQVKIA